MNKTFCLVIVFINLSLFATGETTGESTYVYHNLNQSPELKNLERYKQEKPEEITLTVPEELTIGIRNAPLHFIDQLVKYLVTWTDDDYLKAKSIHDWICLNITYDMVGYNKGEIKLAEPHITLRYQTAVCGGYAALFHEMLTKAGIESSIISGYTKGKSKYAIGDQKIFTRHAWNSIKIYGRYYLVDTTWDAGYVTKNKYVQNYSTDFFLADPTLFVTTHYPIAPGWLLLDSFVSLEEFKILK